MYMDTETAMAATARLVVQMTPQEKASLDARARQAGLPTAEFVRRRIGSDDLDEHRAEIEALLSGLEAAAPTILQSLDSSIARAKALEAELDRIHAGARE